MNKESFYEAQRQVTSWALGAGRWALGAGPVRSCELKLRKAGWLRRSTEVTENNLAMSGAKTRVLIGLRMR